MGIVTETRPLQRQRAMVLVFGTAEIRDLEEQTTNDVLKCFVPFVIEQLFNASARNGVGGCEVPSAIRF